MEVINAMVKKRGGEKLMCRFYDGFTLQKKTEGLYSEIINEHGIKTEEISVKDFYEVLGEGNTIGGPNIKVQKIKRERIENILRSMVGKLDLSRKEVESQLNIDLTADSAFWALHYTGYITKNGERFSISEKGKVYLESL